MSTFLKDEETIKEEILNKIPDTYQKTVGYEMNDIATAVAVPISGLCTDLETCYSKQDVENLSGDELATFIFQRTGLIRKIATYATTTLNLTGNFSIAIGNLFATAGGIQFKTIEVATSTTSASVKVQCTTAGSAGNVIANSITLMPVTLSGVTSVINPNGATGGYNAETDAELIERYYEYLQLPIVSGNKYHYKSWAKSNIGVGNAKVFPLEFGKNTVGVCIIDSNSSPASPELIATVQKYIDPNSSGTGEGEAPIGAYCTVYSATALLLAITCTLTLNQGYILANVKTNIQNAINAYLKSIAFDLTYLSYAKIGNCILDSEGVSDYANLLINGGTTNLNIGDKQVCILNSLGVS